MEGLIAAQPLLVGVLHALVNMCRPSDFKYFTCCLLGFMTLPGRRSIRAIAKASGLEVHAHNFYRFIGEHQWCHRLVSKLLCRFVLRVLGVQPGPDGRYPLFGAVDDTVTAHPSAQKMYGVSYHRDPLARPRQKKYVRGHCFVLTGLLWALPGGRWLFFALAVTRYVSHKAIRPDEVFRTKLELGLAAIDDWGLPTWVHLTVVADNGYDRKSFVLGLLARGYDLVTRLRKDAAVYDLPPPRQPGQRGAPRKYGPRLYLHKLAGQKDRFQSLQVHMYGKTLTLSVACLPVMIKRLKCQVTLVIIAGQRGRPPVFLYSTNLNLTARQIIELYAARFKIEVGIRDLKQHLGLGDSQLRSRQGIERHATFSLLAYTVLQLLPFLDVPFFPRWKGGEASYPTTGQLRGLFQRAVLAHLILLWVEGRDLPGENSTPDQALEMALNAFPVLLPAD